jgi:DHA3 family macrolide efflux protein-like MFS transporter
MNVGWEVSFFAVWIGQAFSLIGSSLVGFALVWWLADTSGSATVLTLAAIANTIPTVLLGPVAGTLVDRWSRRKVMIVSDGLIASFTALLAFLFWQRQVEVWHVLAILFIRSLGDAFQNPAVRASTSLMVPGDQLTHIAGMDATLQGVIRFLSPAMGALLLTALHMQGTLAVDVGTAVLAITPLLFVPVPQPKREVLPGTRAPVPREMLEGLRYVWRARGLLLLFVTAAAAMFFLASPLSLVPLLVTKHFGGGALELGWMQSAYGLGYVLGGGILSLWGGLTRRVATSLLGTVGISLGLIVVGLAPPDAFWLGVGAWFFFGLTLPIATGPLHAIYQSVVPPEMQGRFFTLNRSVINVASPLGLAIGGPLADAIGVRALFIVGGAATLVVALVRAFTPAILALDNGRG